MCCHAVLLDDLGVTQLVDTFNDLGEVHSQDLGQEEPTVSEQAGGER